MDHTGSGPEGKGRDASGRIRREGIPKGARFAILERDQFACHYCGATPPEVKLEVDRIYPVSAGGTNDSWNLAAACWSCNTGKRAREIEAIPDWYDLLEALGELRWWVLRSVPEEERSPWLARVLEFGGVAETRFHRRMETLERRRNPEGV